MLKYVDIAITFAEVPDEIALCINISNCPCHCVGCHSSYLAEDIGDILDEKTLDNLIEKNPGITCVCFMGGDSDPKQVILLAKYVYTTYSLKICWYSGREKLNRELWGDIWHYITYLKLGPYKEQYGPLTNPLTNQRFYKIEKFKEDITYKFLKSKI